MYTIGSIFSLFMWAIPASILMFSAAELLFFWLYQKFGHPWKVIFNAAQKVGNF